MGLSLENDVYKGTDKQSSCEFLRQHGKLTGCKTSTFLYISRSKTCWVDHFWPPGA